MGLERLKFISKRIEADSEKKGKKPSLGLKDCAESCERGTLHLEGHKRMSASSKRFQREYGPAPEESERDRCLAGSSTTRKFGPFIDGRVADNPRRNNLLRRPIPRPTC